MFTGLSILIAAHNRSALTLRTLDSLATLSLPPGLPIECIVIANACTDDTERLVAHRALSMPFPTRAVPEPKVGVANARNRAIAEAAHDLLLFVDSDISCAPDLLLQHLRIYQNYPADLVTGRIDLWWEECQDPGWLTPDMRLALGQHTLGEPASQADPIELKTPDAFSANLSFKRSVLNRAFPNGERPFRTDLGRRGLSRLAGEETLFAQRALDANCRLFYAPAAKVKHWVAASSLRDDFFIQSTYHGSASLVLVYPRFGPLRILKHTATALARIATGTLLQTLTNDPNRRREAKCRVATGKGQLHGLRLRLFGRTDLAHPSPASAA